MSTASVISQRRSPRHYYKPVVGEIVPTHYHYCPIHKEDYPGYHAKCKDPFELLCGRCLAREFGGIHES